MVKAFNINTFRVDYPDDSVCLEKLFQLKNIDMCPKCSRPYNFSRVTGRRAYQCANCSYQIYPTAKTIFEKSTSPLTDWFYAVFLFATTKRGVGAKHFQRHVGINYATVHRMLKKIRSVLTPEENLTLKGTVEVDESFLCGGNKWSRWGGITTRKLPIIGLMERGGKVIVAPITDRKRETVHRIINERVEPGSVVYTDGWNAYKKLSGKYNHDYVNHSSREYVRGDVHTNNIENFWGNLKKSVRSSHVRISEKYLPFYLNEIVYRFNNRNMTQQEMFEDILKRCVNLN